MGINDTAAAIVDQQYQPQQDAIARRLAALQATTGTNSQAITNWGTQGAQGIGNAYDTLDQYLAKNRTDTGNQLGAVANSVSQAYKNATTANNAQTQQSTDYLTNLANKLGVQAALPQQLSQVQQLGNQYAQQARDSDATVTGNVKNWSAMMDSILNQGQNIAKGTRATKLSDLQTQVMKAQGENSLAGVQGQNDLNSRLADILGQRGNALVAEIDKLSQQEWMRQLEQAKLNQAAAIHNSSMGAESARLALAQKQADQADYWHGQEFMRQMQGDKNAQSKWQDELGLEKQKLTMESQPRKMDLLKMISSPGADVKTIVPYAQSLGIPGFEPGSPMDKLYQQSIAKPSESNSGGGGFNLGDILQTVGNHADPFHEIYQGGNALIGAIDKHLPSWSRMPSWMK